MADFRHKLTKTFTPVATGLNASTLEAERTSSTLMCTGYDQMTIFVDHENSGCTRVDLNIDASPDDGTTWFPVQTTAVSAGAVTLSDADYQKTVSANDEWIINTPINYDHVRIRVSSGAGSPVAADTVKVYVKISSL